ncbi:hypothetical protein BY996DRAFT_6414756 [Phakopsora pachyrhizi]|nr:hypothetical protein BY996DRAFT_6414756 [Phakopsora pachyrhizi]
MLYMCFEAASREDLQGLSHNIEAPSDILEYKHFLKPKTIPTSFDSGVIIEQAPLLFSKADFSTEKYGLNEKSLARSSGVVPKAAMKDGEKGYNSICYSNSDKAQISKGKGQLYYNCNNFLPTVPEIRQNYFDPIEQCLNQHKPTAQLSGIKPLINSIPPGNNEESAPGFLKGRYLDKGENTLKENFHWSRHSNFFLDEFDKQFSQLEYPDRNILGQGNNYEECFIDNSKNMDFNFYPQQTKTPNDSYGLVSQPEKDWKYIPMEQVAISNFDEIDGDSLWISELVGGKTIGELHQAYSQLELINSPMEKTDSLPNLHVTGFEEYPSPKVPHQIKESESYKLAWIEDSGLDVLSGKRGKNKAAASKDKSNNDQDNLQKEDKSFEPVTSVDLIPKNKDETLIQELQDLIQREDLVLSSKFFNEKITAI